MTNEDARKLITGEMISIHLQNRRQRAQPGQRTDFRLVLFEDGSGRLELTNGELLERFYCWQSLHAILTRDWLCPHCKQRMP